MLTHRLTLMQSARSALLATALLVAGCAVNPATGEFEFMLVSEAEEKAIGERAHSQITAGYGGIYDDLELAAYLNSVGQRLAAHTELPDLDYRFTILDSPIVNAFAAPGGYVYVTRGLLALPVNEALHLRRFSREQEFEADRLAVRYLTRAGYPADAMRSLLRTLQAHSATKSSVAVTPSDQQRPNHASTHPLTAERLDQVTLVTRQNRTNVSHSDDGAYLAAVDGLLYGNRADVGFVTGQQFANPDRRIAFDVPEGFVISATRDQVTGSGPLDTSIIFEAARVRFTGTMLSYLTTLWARDLPLDESHAAEINGMDAAVGWTHAIPSGDLLSSVSLQFALTERISTAF